MNGLPEVTAIGTLTADPELRYTQTGTAVTNFTVAANARKFDKDKNEWIDGDATFLRCNLWRQPAENLAESLHKGDRVIVTGVLRQRSYETKEGEKRTVFELEVNEVGPSLRWAQAQVSKVKGNGGKPRSKPADDWEPPTDDDQPPF